MYSFLKLALRHFQKNKSVTFINITGFSLGLAASLIILIFVRFEYSHENMHPDLDRIYRVLTIDAAFGTNSQRVGITIPPLGPVIPDNFPEVESTIRIAGGNKVLLSYQGETGVFAEEIRSTDANFFDFFGYKLLEGNPKTALTEPFSLVLTEKLSKKIFSTESALGKVLITGDSTAFTVTGIMQDMPPNTHLTLDALQSISTDRAQAIQFAIPGSNQPIWLENWNMIAMPTYLKLKNQSLPADLNKRLTDFIYANNVSPNFSITLQPLKDVHLRSTDIIFDTVVNKGDINNIYIFTVIALFILFIASVNYMNLSTVKSMQWAKEVGIRKVSGSTRIELIRQFIGESIMISFISLVFAIVLSEVAQVVLLRYAGINLPFSLFSDIFSLIIIFLMIFIIGFFSGIYPALILSSFNPSKVLKGSISSGKSGENIRRLLVVLQFAISIGLIGATLFVTDQLNYMKNRDIGYNREQVIIFDMLDQKMMNNITLFRDKLTEQSEFVKVGTAGNIPGRTFGRRFIVPDSANADDQWVVNAVGMSREAMEVLEMKITAGDPFPPFTDQQPNEAIINETAVKAFGWGKPLERKIGRGVGDTLGTPVRAIVKDFNFIEMRQKIEPVIIYPLIGWNGNIVIAKTNEGSLESAMEKAKQVWNQVYPDYPFSYTFMDTEFEALYKRDRVTGTIIQLFSLFGIFVACLGLFGLVSYTINLRKKEIAIRKALGAGTVEIINLMAFDFLRWVVLSNVLALPIVYYSMKKWLQNFAYQTELNLWNLLFAGLITFVIAALTISYNIYRAAETNPAEVMRYE